MELTGKCKQEFEKWLTELGPDKISFDDGTNAVYVNAPQFFNQLLPSMKYGVYVDFFDSKDIYIAVDSGVNREDGEISVEHRGEIMNDKGSYVDATLYFSTRPEVRTEVIKKANELYNERNK